MLVVIRADSSSVIGSGHLMRCLTLAEKFRKEDNAEAHFISRDLEGNLNFLVEKKNFSLHTLPRHEYDASLTGYAAWLTVTEETDATETQKVLEQLGFVDMLVVDSYAIGEAWEKKLRPRAKKIFVIDDLANRRHDCDILLDQNFYLDKDLRYKNLVPPHCRLLLGPKHALLREEFFRAKERMRVRDGQLKNILVFYGGADATGETEKALLALSRWQENGALADIKVTVVTGGSNVRKAEIKKHCRQAGFAYRCQVSNMAELMNEADLMLGAGGSTTWERCCLGLPAIVTAVAENQFKICEDCSRAGLIHYLGRWNEVSVDDLAEAIKYMMEPDNLRALISSCRLDIGA